MSLRICSYNLEWFDDLFAPDHSLRRGRVNADAGGFRRPGVMGAPPCGRLAG